ncbi:MAG: hypothetical protein IPK80_30475 [Nannocystis sp.]|nr:hypothetical protein [Nannocystis sp.]
MSRVVLADGRALIHADGIKLEVDAELVRGLVGDGGGRRALLLAWSLHDLPSIDALAASVPEDEAPDQAPDNTPTEAPVAPSDQRRVDEEFSALFRSAPVASEPNSAVPTVPTAGASPLEMIFSMLKPS